MAIKITEGYPIPGTSLSARNRTLLAAMTNKQSDEDGTPSDNEISWLLRRAEGGFDSYHRSESRPPGREILGGEMGVWSDHHIPKLEQLANCIRERGP